MIFLLIWPCKCLILMILSMTKYHENLLRDSNLSLLFVVKYFSSLETKMILKIPNETFLRTDQYYQLTSISLWRYCVLISPMFDQFENFGMINTCYTTQFSPKRNTRLLTLEKCFSF